MGKFVLAFFGKKIEAACRNYRTFVAKGIPQGRRNDLIGGGLVRSSGGWVAVKALRAMKAHMKSDERILGDGDFVTAMPAKNDEDIDNAYMLRSKGVDLEVIARRVAHLLEMEPEDVWSPGKYRRLVMARSL